jgi:AraC-like DNA-binding protein
MDAALESLGFIAPPADAPGSFLGVVASRAPPQTSVEFKVPAHALATLNWVLGTDGAKRLHVRTPSGLRLLPSAFATGAHARHRSYVLDAGSVLLTAMLRADALAAPLPQRSANRWLAPAELFAQGDPASTWAPQDWEAAAKSLMHCSLVTASQGVDPQAPYTLIQTALRLMQTHSIAHTADAMRMSERGLQRLLAQRWGLSPKRVQRLVRVQLGLQRWHTVGGRMSLAELAHDCGLVDQAHLAREFRELIGHAPRVLKGGGVALAAQMQVFRETWGRFV